MTEGRLDYIRTTEGVPDVDVKLKGGVIGHLDPEIYALVITSEFDGTTVLHASEHIGHREIAEFCREMARHQDQIADKVGEPKEGEREGGG